MWLRSSVATSTSLVEEDETSGYFKTTLNSAWFVSHFEGCKSCEGTHYYHPKTEWSFLDAILVRRASVEDHRLAGRSRL
jgi:hypothetical protein